MRVRGWGWVLLAAATQMGCDSAESADGAGYGDPHGGQTGSLRPCSAPAHAQPVPTGDAALVFHTGCGAEGGLAIRDESGALISFEVEEIDDGVVLLRTEGTLTPGEYSVETPTGTETLTVTESEPLPMRLGTLSRMGSSCSDVFELGFDPAVMPYRPLLKLVYSLDDGPETTWFEYGTVQPFATTVQLATGTLSRGAHQLEVSAAIAGETAAPEPVTLSFEYDCSASGTAGDAGYPTCALPRGAPLTGASDFTGGFSLLAMMLLLLGRRRTASVK